MYVPPRPQDLTTLGNKLGPKLRDPLTGDWGTDHPSLREFSQSLHAKLIAFHCIPFNIPLLLAQLNFSQGVRLLLFH